MDDLLKDFQGGEWRPKNLVQPALAKALLSEMSKLKKTVDVLENQDLPSIKKMLARLNMYLAKANQVKSINHVDYLVFIANALIDIQEIVGWYQRNKQILKGGKNG
jgi:hypothetical protein